VRILASPDLENKPLDAGFELRPYQLDALQGIVRSWQQHDRTLLVQPTASGKTIVLAAVAKRRRAFGRVPVLAHTDELVSQARDKLRRTNGLESDLEKAEDRASLEAPLVVSSVQTLSRPSRLERFAPDHFRTLIVDEAHHSLAASYRRILDHFSLAKVLGVTATPDRGDKRSLAALYQDIAHEVSMVDLIRSEYLCPIRVQTVPVKIDISKVAIRAGDFSEVELAEALDPVLERVAEQIAEYALARKTLVFVPLILTAERFAAILREAGFNAEFVSGKCQDRSEKLRRFAQGQTQVLVNAQLLTEGYDEPGIDCVVVLRPTRSRPFFAQMIGRGTRIHPGKQDLLLLDFLWLTSQHSLIRPASLVAKDEKEAAEIERCLERAGGDLIGAADIAALDRTKALARALQENADRRAKRIDIFELELSFRAPGLSDYEPTMLWLYEQPTERQLAYIARCGINPEQIRCKGEASAIIDLLEKRRCLGLATFKQARLMRRLGHPKPHEVSFSAASDWISDRLRPAKRTPHL
jgi:superfamily II DNA or RNA helicase